MKGHEAGGKFLRQGICPDCGGTRLCNAARTPKLRGITLDKACQMTSCAAYRLGGGCAGQSAGRDAAHGPQYLRILPDGSGTAALAGPGYLTLDRSASTLSTGERQRMQLARAVRNRTTGVLYVLDEPSIGLHPSNIEA